MTPEKALGILEGKIPRELPEETTDDKKAQVVKKKPAVKNSLSMGADTQPLPILAVILITAALVAVYYRGISTVSESAYKNGFNQGMSTINPNLILAQKEVGDKAAQITSLKQDLAKTEDAMAKLQRDLSATQNDLQSMTAQKDHLAQRLKETQEWIPKKIKAIEGVYGEKIKRIKDKSQKKVTLFNQALSSAEHDLTDEEKELNNLRKQVIEAQEQRNQALDVISQREEQLSRLQKQLNDKTKQFQDLRLQKGPTSAEWQQQIAKLQDDLKSVTAQKDSLTQRLKDVQSSAAKLQPSACMSPPATDFK